MEEYTVILTPDAEADLQKLRDYMADVLLVPEVAFRYLRSLRAEIGQLSCLPARAALVGREPWRSYGIRRMVVKNFLVYYRVDEAARRVYVLNVIYGRRDQLLALRGRKLDELLQKENPHGKTNRHL